MKSDLVALVIAQRAGGLCFERTVVHYITAYYVRTFSKWDAMGWRRLRISRRCGGGR